MGVVGCFGGEVGGGGGVDVVEEGLVVLGEFVIDGGALVGDFLAGVEAGSASVDEFGECVEVVVRAEAGGEAGGSGDFEEHDGGAVLGDRVVGTE